MNQNESQADELHTQVLANYLMLAVNDLSPSEKIEKRTEFVALCAKAIEAGLSNTREVFCRNVMGVAFCELSVETGEFENIDVSLDFEEMPLEQYPLATNGISQIEQAFILDSQTEAPSFVDAKLENRISLKMLTTWLNILWVYQGQAVENKMGLKAEISYLTEKMNLLNYTRGSYLPAVCNEIGNSYYKMDEIDAAKQWFNRALTTDDFAEADDLWSQKFQSEKAEAKQALETVSKPKVEAKSGGCFIATAAYGTSVAPELLTFYRFRDEILLTSKLGSWFVEFYYVVAPPCALLISKAETLKSATRFFLLTPMLQMAKFILRSK